MAKEAGNHKDKYIAIDAYEWLKPGVDFKNLPGIFKIYSKSLKLWLFFERKPIHTENYYKVPREKLKGFPPNSGTYELSDTANPVSVIVPSQNNDIQTHAIHYGAGMAGPCMTPRGVELVIANTVYNPNIRWIILAGADSGHLTGDMFDCLIKYGIDKDKRVINAKSPTYPYLKNLPPEIIEHFRNQVEVINLLKCTDIDVISFVTRMCLQEDYNAFSMELNGRIYHPYDKGAFCKEPLHYDFSVAKLGCIYDNYGAFSGTSIHALTVAEAFSNIQGFLLNSGNWEKQESTRMGIDCTNVSVTIYNTKKDTVPKDYRPQSWLESDDDTIDYLEKYSIWVYLFPLTDVKYDDRLKKTVPKLVENLEYTYGTRLTAYSIELCNDKSEIKKIKNLVKDMHARFYKKAPSFEDVLEFYKRLHAVQKKTFNSLYALAKGCATAVSDNIGNSYRMYATLQIPSVDLAEKSIYEMHNPCFCLYQPNPRFIKYAVVENNGETHRIFLPSGQENIRHANTGQGWFIFPLMSMRAHDIMAFPSNAKGGLALSEFICWYIKKNTGINIEVGHYTQFASSLHIIDYALDKKIIDRFNKD